MDSMRLEISLYLSPVLVRDGEDTHDGVAILLDEIVHVLGEHGLSDHGNLQTSGHGSRKVLITIIVKISNLYKSGYYPGHTATAPVVHTLAQAWREQE